MQRTFLFVIPFLLATAGCGRSDAAAGGDVPASVTNELQGLGGAAKTAGGDYDKLSDADKQKFVDRAGSEAGARAMVTQMAKRPAPRP